ncbi:hypothetical protein GCM10010195_10210 [Kitasatospora griseola]|nr:hypothetical protein GCM10010195_10210 [Kitasatospora griseola]
MVATVAGGATAPDVLDAMDIGVSYGVLASLGGLAGLLRRPGRALALGAGLALIGHQLLTDPDLVTSVGHPAAMLLGVAMWPWLRRGRGPRGPERVRAWKTATAVEG